MLGGGVGRGVCAEGTCIRGFPCFIPEMEDFEFVEGREREGWWGPGCESHHL